MHRFSHRDDRLQSHLRIDLLSAAGYAAVAGAAAGLGMTLLGVAPGLLAAVIGVCAFLLVLLTRLYQTRGR